MAIKNEKFERFLKQTLDKAVLDQVKVFEPCVTYGKSENHFFRYSFFTNEALHISENPPKSILLNVPFTSIFTVTLIHDTATFLQKDLQENVQHVLLTLFSNSTKPYSSLTANSKTGSPIRSLVTSLRLTKSVSPDSNKASDVLNNENLVSESTRKSNEEKLPNYFPHVTSNNPSPSKTSNEPRLSSWLNNNYFFTDESEVSKFETETLHLYVLNADSMFYGTLVAVWKAFLLSSTYLTEKPFNISNPPLRNVSEVLLNELKHDILLSFERSSPVEDVYRYFLELHDVIKRSSKAKEFFWRDGNLLRVSQNLLNRFSTSKAVVLAKRNDEIECMIMICEVIAQMFLQVEGLAACDATLQNLGSDFYASFLTVLLRQPDVPTSMLVDTELQSLLHDYVGISCQILYEMIIASDRTMWKTLKFQTPSAMNLFSIIDSNASTGKFLQRIVSYCVSIWTRADNANKFQSSISPFQTPLSAGEVAKVYQCFAFLYHCLKKCKKYQKIIRDTFKEEFKYYIRPESLEKKIPLSYPASFMTRDIVSTVAKLVLDSTCNAEPSATCHYKMSP